MGLLVLDPSSAVLAQKAKTLETNVGQKENSPYSGSWQPGKTVAWQPKAISQVLQSESVLNVKEKGEVKSRTNSSSVTHGPTCWHQGVCSETAFENGMSLPVVSVGDTPDEIRKTQKGLHGG